MTTYMPGFVREAMERGPRVEQMGETHTTPDGVTTIREWTQTTRVLPEPYRGWWIFERTAPESPRATGASGRRSYSAYHAEARYLERHVYTTESGEAPTLETIQAEIDAIMARDATPVPARTRQSMQAWPEPELVLADCGHYCSPALVMNATIGTSCPDCYDDSERRFGGGARDA